MSLDGFLGDISDEEIRHRKSSSHRVQPVRRKPEKVRCNSELIIGTTDCYWLKPSFPLCLVVHMVIC